MLVNSSGRDNKCLLYSIVGDNEYILTKILGDREYARDILANPEMANRPAEHNERVRYFSPVRDKVMSDIQEALKARNDLDRFIKRMLTDSCRSAKYIEFESYIEGRV